MMNRCDDECGVIEMSIVAQPFVVDFAQAYLDQAPTFDPEVWQDTYAAWESRFESDWPRVNRLLRGLEELGIYYLDVHRGNISFGYKAGVPQVIASSAVRTTVNDEGLEGQRHGR